MKRIHYLSIPLTVIVVLLFIGTTTVRAQVQAVESEDQEWDPGERHDAFISIWKNDKMGCKDSLGRTIVTCKYDDVYSFYDGMARVVRGGKYGYVDLRGKEVVRCKYDYVSPVFSDDRALVRLDGKYGYIDKKGKAVIPLKYTWPSLEHYDSVHQTEILYFGNQPSTFRKGSAIINDEGKMYLIDVNGEKLTPDGFSSFCRFHKNVALVCRDGKWGSVNRQGKEVEPCVHDYHINSFNLLGNDIYFSDDRANVYRLEGQKQLYGVIDYRGREAIPCLYDEPLEFPDYPSFEITIAKKNGEQILVDYTGYELKGYGYWLKGLAQVIRDKDVLDCNEYGVVIADKNGGKGVVNYMGTIIVAPRYKKIMLKNDGYYYAFVTDFNDKQGVIDHRGKNIVPCEYDYVSTIVPNIYDSSSKLLAAYKDDKPFYFDFSGNPVDYNPSEQMMMTEERVVVESRSLVSEPDRYSQRGNLSEGMQSVRKDSKWGFVDERDKEVVPLVYDIAYQFKGDLAKVKKNGVWGFVDRHGHSTFDYQ